MSSEQFVRTCRLPVSAAEAYAWHMREGAFWRLAPAWEDMELIDGEPVPHEGSLLRFKVKQGPLHTEWRARHSDFVPGREFTDVQERGPFAYWKHVHKMIDDSSGRGILEDSVEYSLPFALNINPLARQIIKAKIEQMFDYRHTVLTNDLRYFAKYRSVRRKRILVVGSEGMLGAQLIPFLQTQGHEAVGVSSHTSDGQSVASALDHMNIEQLEGFDAIVNLSAESILDERRKTIGDNGEAAIASTAALISLLKRCAPNMVLINLSSTEIYGRRPAEKIDEKAEISNESRAQVLGKLESICSEAEQIGIRVANLRMGHIIAPKAGFLKMLLSAYHPGTAIELHSETVLSWISLCDAIYAIYHAVMNNSVLGKINVVSPEPVTAAEFAFILNQIVMPHSLLSLPLSHRSLEEIETDDCFVLGNKLSFLGFQCAFADLETALRHLVGKTHGAAQSLFASM